MSNLQDQVTRILWCIEGLSDEDADATAEYVLEVLRAAQKAKETSKAEEEEETQHQQLVGEDFWAQGYWQGRHDAQVGNPYDEWCGRYGPDYADGYRTGWRNALFMQEDAR